MSVGAKRTAAADVDSAATFCRFYEMLGIHARFRRVHRGGPTQRPIKMRADPSASQLSARGADVAAHALLSGVEIRKQTRDISCW